MQVVVKVGRLFFVMHHKDAGLLVELVNAGSYYGIEATHQPFEVHAYSLIGLEAFCYRLNDRVLFVNPYEISNLQGAKALGAANVTNYSSI